LPRAALADHGCAARATVLLLAREPDRSPRVTSAHLAELYNLTSAEARTAQALLAGKGPREIAAALNVGVATVHTRLHRVFDKTGTTRQAELLRLLMEIASLGD
jgi:DNA-binding CsgD family transcriptional regulator